MKRLIYSWSAGRSLKRTAWLIATLLSLALLLPGQSTYSEILGTVVDPSSLAVAGAKVVVRSMDTNIPNETATDSQGRFRVRQLLLGNYQVEVEKAGFARYVQGPITLRLNQNAELNITLSVSSVSETITVQANATMVNTTNAEVATQFESRRVSELPL